jgi:hypothetical protein
VNTSDIPPDIADSKNASDWETEVSDDSSAVSPIPTAASIEEGRDSSAVEEQPPLPFELQIAAELTRDDSTDDFRAAIDTHITKVDNFMELPQNDSLVLDHSFNADLFAKDEFDDTMDEMGIDINAEEDKSVPMQALIGSHMEASDASPELHTITFSDEKAILLKFAAEKAAAEMSGPESVTDAGRQVSEMRREENYTFANEMAVHENVVKDTARDVSTHGVGDDSFPNVSFEDRSTFEDSPSRSASVNLVENVEKKDEQFDADMEAVKSGMNFVHNASVYANEASNAASRGDERHMEDITRVSDALAHREAERQRINEFIQSRVHRGAFFEAIRRNTGYEPQPIKHREPHAVKKAVTINLDTPSSPGFPVDDMQSPEGDSPKDEVLDEVEEPIDTNNVGIAGAYGEDEIDGFDDDFMERVERASFVAQLYSHDSRRMSLYTYQQDSKSPERRMHELEKGIQSAAEKTSGSEVDMIANASLYHYQQRHYSPDRKNRSGSVEADIHTPVGSISAINTPVGSRSSLYDYQQNLAHGKYADLQREVDEMASLSSAQKRLTDSGSVLRSDISTGSRHSLADYLNRSRSLMKRTGRKESRKVGNETSGINNSALSDLSRVSGISDISGPGREHVHASKKERSALYSRMILEKIKDIDAETERHETRIDNQRSVSSPDSRRKARMAPRSPQVNSSMISSDGSELYQSFMDDGREWNSRFARYYASRHKLYSDSIKKNLSHTVKLSQSQLEMQQNIQRSMQLSEDSRDRSRTSIGSSPYLSHSNHVADVQYIESESSRSDGSAYVSDNASAVDDSALYHDTYTGLDTSLLSRPRRDTLHDRGTQGYVNVNVRLEPRPASSRVSLSKPSDSGIHIRSRDNREDDSWRESYTEEAFHGRVRGSQDHVVTTLIDHNSRSGMQRTQAIHMQLGATKRGSHHSRIDGQYVVSAGQGDSYSPVESEDSESMGSPSIEGCGSGYSSISSSDIREGPAVSKPRHSEPVSTAIHLHIPPTLPTRRKKFGVSSRQSGAVRTDIHSAELTDASPSSQLSDYENIMDINSPVTKGRSLPNERLNEEL